jgi:hypothetical protein
MFSRQPFQAPPDAPEAAGETVEEKDVAQAGGAGGGGRGGATPAPARVNFAANREATADPVSVTIELNIR